MRRLEQISIEEPVKNGGETAIDTQIEVDLICGGVGFDDDPAEGGKWLKKKREKSDGAAE